MTVSFNFQFSCLIFYWIFFSFIESDRENSVSDPLKKKRNKTRRKNKRILSEKYGKPLVKKKGTLQSPVTAYVLYQELANYGPWAKSSLLLFFVLPTS